MECKVSLFLVDADGELQIKVLPQYREAIKRMAKLIENSCEKKGDLTELSMQFSSEVVVFSLNTTA